MRNFCLFMFIVFVMGSVTSCGKEHSVEAVKDNSGPVPEVKKIDAEGLDRLLADNKGKVIILNIFTTWCFYCKKEMPGFIDLHEKYKDEGLESIAVSVDKANVDKIQRFVEKNKINFPVFLSSGGIVSKYSVTGLPHTVIYDRSGKAVKTHVGFGSKDFFEEEIKKLL
ncbi:MAG: TlpA family protein disulfide reductase [Candidatus Aureabacteria bacterium]|nr:TlpA family protein disulfide reductase [Candidatus Auribacterota bacterium]